MTFDADIHTLETARDLVAFILELDSVPEHELKLVENDSVPVTIPVEMNP